MNDIWVLFVKTTLPDEGVPSRDLKTSVYAFDGFEKAREAFRRVVKDFAFSENPMFDGDGRIKHLQEYNERMNRDDGDDDFDGELTYWVLSNIQDALRDAFSGKDLGYYGVPDDTYTDWMIAVDVEDGAINFFGDDDGPFNGYDPTIKTNIFNMQEEKDYYLYIDDLLGQDEGWTSELYIDLKKVNIN